LTFETKRKGVLGKTQGRLKAKRLSQNRIAKVKILQIET
jgi:hypothetical protein